MGLPIGNSGPAAVACRYSGQKMMRFAVSSSSMRNITLSGTRHSARKHEPGDESAARAPSCAAAQRSPKGNDPPPTQMLMDLANAGVRFDVSLALLMVHPPCSIE